MTEKEFADLCQARGYRLTGSGKAVGTELGWPVTLIYGKKTLTLCLPAEKGERKLRARGLKRGLRERLGRNASTIWGNGFVAVYLKLKGVSSWSGWIKSGRRSVSLRFSSPERRRHSPAQGRL